MAAALRSSLQFSLLSGASFLDHPGGEGVPVSYTINVVDHEHPVTQGIGDIEIASERHYMRWIRPRTCGDQPRPRRLRRGRRGGTTGSRLAVRDSQIVRSSAQDHVRLGLPGGTRANARVPRGRRSAPSQRCALGRPAAPGLGGSRAPSRTSCQHASPRLQRRRGTTSVSGLGRLLDVAMPIGFRVRARPEFVDRRPGTRCLAVDRCAGWLTRAWSV